MGITEHEYSQMPGLRFSALVKMAKSARAFRENVRIESDALSLGTLVHALVLEPDSFADRFTVAPSVDRRTKDGKKQYADWLAENGSKTAVDAAMLARAQLMRDAVLAEPEARRLLDNAEHIERVTLWTDPETGLECKCKADIVTRDGILVDLKTSRDIGSRAFAASCGRYRYHAQFGYYGMGIGDVRENRIIAAQSVGETDCAVYRLDSATVACGEALAREWLRRVKQCESEQRWPGVANGGVLDLELPEWALGSDSFEWGDAA